MDLLACRHCKFRTHSTAVITAVSCAIAGFQLGGLDRQDNATAPSKVTKGTLDLVLREIPASSWQRKGAAVDSRVTYRLKKEYI
jgi:hypothetical protein